MATINVKDAGDITVAIEKPLAPSRASSALSRPVVLSNEDKAALDLVSTKLDTIDGRVDGLETLITSTNSKLDTAITALQIIDNMVLDAGSAIIGKVDHTTTGIGHGVKTVTTAGTDVVLAASTAAKWATIQAQTDNTGIIAVGATGVDATVATGTGVALAAGESITLPIDNLADVFIDATVSGEGVRYTYGT